MIFVREYCNGHIISSGSIGVGGIGDIGYWSVVVIISRVLSLRGA